VSTVANEFLSTRSIRTNDWVDPDVDRHKRRDYVAERRDLRSQGVWALVMRNVEVQRAIKAVGLARSL